MAIQSASAKLYTGIRCWVVDKNISAALTSSFSLGNKNRPASGGDTVFANVLVFKLQRAIADLVMTPSLTLTDSRLKTFGGGNTIYDGYFVRGQRYKIVNVGNSDWNAIAGTTEVSYVLGSEFLANNNGTLPSVSPVSFTPDDKRNPTAKTGKASLASWTARSSVVCKFPTYFRIDVDKLDLPQGTTCTVSFEEDWIRDGVYLESTKASSAAIGNFFTFRTPWKGASFINSTFTLPNRTALRIKQLASSISSTASFTALPIFNPGKLAALFMGVSQIVPNAVKTAVSGATLLSSFTPVALGLRIKQLASLISFDSSVTTEFDIVQVSGSTQSAESNINADAIMFKGSLPSNLQSLVQIDTAPNATFRGRSQSNNISATLFSRSTRIKQISSAITTPLFNIPLANINHIQRVPRWRSGGSYTIVGGETNIISNTDYVKLSGSQMRRYQNGTLIASDAVSVSVSDPSKRFDVGSGGFYVAAGAVIDYGTFQSSNTPINIDSPVVAVCKLTGNKFAIYNPSTARIEIYNTSGSKQTIYDATLALNIGEPRNMSIRSGSGTNLDIVSCSSGGFRHMKYNSGSYVTTTINTGVSTDFRKMWFSDDGLTLFIEGFDATAAYFMTRASITSSFTTIQTITDPFIAAGYSAFGFDQATKQFVFINNRSYQWSGSNFVYVRDAVYNVPGLVFGSSSGATHISGTTATNLTFS